MHIVLVRVCVGNGVVVHLPQMFQEIERNAHGMENWSERLIISDRCHIGEVTFQLPEHYYQSDALTILQDESCVLPLLYFSNSP